ncbi:MAG: hypothetical protein ACYC21_06385 [Eubacteriales bacterium]
MKNENSKKKDNDYKQQPPREFIPTELGSAVFANINGRPTDEEYLIENKNDGDEADEDTSKPKKAGR